MIGRTNTGGGKIKDTDAILTVTVPTGSTVTMTKGGVTLAPTMWVQAADNTKDCALFVITPSNFDSLSPWTVAATNDGITRSATVVINENKEYSMTFSLHVPNGYTEVEYIENTGSSWINFDVAPEIVFKAKFRCCATTQTGNHLFAIYQTAGGTTSYRMQIFYNNNRYGFAAYIGSETESGKYLQSQQDAYKMVELEYEQGSNFQKLSGFGETVSYTKVTAARQMCSFFRYRGGADVYMKGRLQYGELWNDNALSRKMYSCYRDSDSVAGMYDIVSNSFIENAGSGSFTLGPEVVN